MNPVQVLNEAIEAFELLLPKETNNLKRLGSITVEQPNPLNPDRLKYVQAVEFVWGHVVTPMDTAEITGHGHIILKIGHDTSYVICNFKRDLHDTDMYTTSRTGEFVYGWYEARERRWHFEHNRDKKLVLDTDLNT